MFSFYRHRYKFFALSALIFLIGIAVSLFAGIKLDIQFKGGSIIEYALTAQTIDLPKAEDIAETAIGRPVTAQVNQTLGSQSQSLVISVAGDAALSPDELQKLRTSLQQAFSGETFETRNATIVDPFLGGELLRKGILAIALASVLIIAYVSFSFRSISGPSAGVMAIVALFHDVFVAFFVFVVTRAPINESLVAVVLTILGFSINDTIVIYDRIRENKRILGGKMALADLVDLSINQSLTRSINTSLCTIAAVLVAYIFALIYDINSIKEFALPMIIGLISGSYSTICLAGPLWVMWKTRGGRSGY